MSARAATARTEQALALQNWFRDNFEYDLAVDPGHSSSRLDTFLLEEQRGYCEQFAGAFAVLGRTLGLPTRVAVGFTPGVVLAESEPAGTLYSVRGEHAHAWPEVYIDGAGWVAFEPTPGRGAPGAEGYTLVAEQQDSPGPSREPALSPPPPPTPPPQPPGAESPDPAPPARYGRHRRPDLGGHDAARSGVRGSVAGGTAGRRRALRGRHRRAGEPAAATAVALGTPLCRAVHDCGLGGTSWPCCGPGGSDRDRPRHLSRWRSGRRRVSDRHPNRGTGWPSASPWPPMPAARCRHRSTGRPRTRPARSPQRYAAGARSRNGCGTFAIRTPGNCCCVRGSAGAHHRRHREARPDGRRATGVSRYVARD